MSNTYVLIEVLMRQNQQELVINSMWRARRRGGGWKDSEGLAPEAAEKVPLRGKKRLRRFGWAQCGYC